MLRTLRFLPFFALRHVMFPLVAIGAVLAGITYLVSKQDEAAAPKAR